MGRRFEATEWKDGKDGKGKRIKERRVEEKKSAIKTVLHAFNCFNILLCLVQDEP